MKRTKAIDMFTTYTLAMVSGVFSVKAFIAPTPAEMVFYGVVAAFAVIATILNSLCKWEENESQDK